MRALVAIGVLACAAHAAAAPPLVVFHAPPRAGGETTATREALSRVAAAASAAFVDLSPAPPPVPAAPALLARAVELYDGLRLDDAQAALDDALAEARATGAAGLTASQLSDLFLYRSLVASARGEAAQAWDDLVRAATVDETRALDPARFPPKVLQSFARAALAVRGREHGRIAVTGADGCRVAIDARAAAAAPAYGEHFVRVECPGAPAAAALVLLSRPTQEVAPPRADVAPPDDAALLALARERGAGRLLVATVRESPLGPPTTRLRLIDAAAGTTLADAGAQGAAEARAAAERLLARDPDSPLAAPPPPPPAQRAEPRRWYTRPWLWGAVGLAAGVAIALPFALGGDDSPSRFTLRSPGPLWP